MRLYTFSFLLLALLAQLLVLVADTVGTDVLNLLLEEVVHPTLTSTPGILPSTPGVLPSSSTVATVPPAVPIPSTPSAATPPAAPVEPAVTPTTSPAVIPPPAPGVPPVTPTTPPVGIPPVAPIPPTTTPSIDPAATGPVQRTSTYWINRTVNGVPTWVQITYTITFGSRSQGPSPGHGEIGWGTISEAANAPEATGAGNGSGRCEMGKMKMVWVVMAVGGWLYGLWS